MLRRLTRKSNPYAITDRIMNAYIKIILRRFRKLQDKLSIMEFDELNVLNAVDSTYEEVIKLTVEGLGKVAQKEYKWLTDDDFMFELWLSEYLEQYDETTKYQFYPEADRKRARTFEALMSCRTAADRKKEVDTALRYWTKQAKQTADDVTDAVIKKAYQDNNVKYVQWITMHDAKVCQDCHDRDGKIYPINSPMLQAVHYNCRCFWIPVIR